MKLYFRILVAVYSIFAIVLGTMMVSARFSREFMFGLMGKFDVMLDKSLYAGVLFLLAAFVFILVNVIFLFSAFVSDKDKSRISRLNEQGEISVSLSAIDAIAVIVTERFQEVTEVKTKVSKKEETIELVLRLKVFAEANIPTLAESIQKKVKETVEGNIGVKVSGVKVVIDNIQSSFKPA